MKRLKLTIESVTKLPYAEKGKQVDYFDTELDGFGVRVSATGKKYFVRRQIGPKRVRVMIGSASIKSAEAARKEAKIQLGIMESGIDPNEQKKEKARLVEAEKQQPTIAALVTEYIERHAKKFKRSWKEDERLLQKEIVPAWGNKKAKDITKRDVTLLLEQVVDRGAPAMSNQVLKITRKMFNFAVERDIIQHTPFAGVKALAPNNSRERTLTEVEIRTLWVSLDSAAISSDMRRALKLVLVTGQRPGEVAGMHSSEIDGQWWTIPAGRAKNGREHRVFLTPTALDLIGPLTAMDDEIGEEIPKGYIFPCPHRTKKQPIDSHGLPVAVRRNLAWPITDKNGQRLYGKDGQPAIENRLGVAQFTPHDLRRTAATFMAAMGFMDEIVDAVLNHAKQGVIRTYNRHKYDREKQLALQAWERKIVCIINGKSASNVIAMQRVME